MRTIAESLEHEVICSGRVRVLRDRKYRGKRTGELIIQIPESYDPPFFVAVRFMSAVIRESTDRVYLFLDTVIAAVLISDIRQDGRLEGSR